MRVNAAHPSFNENGKIHFADNCLPLKEAAKKGTVQMEAWGRFNYPGQRLADSMLPGLNSVGYWDASFDQNWGLGLHQNEGLEISFIEKGAVPFSVNSNNYLLRANNLTITRPWQLHRVGNPLVTAGKFCWLIIDVNVRHPHQDWTWPDWIILSRTDLAELTKMLRQNEQPVWNTDANLKKCFQKICTSLRERPLETSSWMALHVNELLLTLLSIFREGRIDLSEELTESKRTVGLFIKNLETTFAEPWTLETMAEHCHLKPTRFAYYFKEIVNLSPLHYLTNVRLNAAADLLAHRPELTIKSICYSCGFSSSEYFSTAFKKKFSSSPGSFRVVKTIR